MKNKNIDAMQMHMNKNNLLQIYEFYVICVMLYCLYKELPCLHNISRNANLFYLPLQPDFQKVGIG